MMRRLKMLLLSLKRVLNHDEEKRLTYAFMSTWLEKSMYDADKILDEMKIESNWFYSLKLKNARNGRSA